VRLGRDMSSDQSAPVINSVAAMPMTARSNKPIPIGADTWTPISLYQKRCRTLFVIESIDAKTSARHCRRHDVTAERAKRGGRKHRPASASNDRKEEGGSCQ